MTRRVTFDDGNWADLREPHVFGGDAQEDYWDLAEKMSAESADGELTGKGGRQIRDWVIGKLIADWSYEAALPFTTELRLKPPRDGGLPLPTLNRLYAESKPFTDALNGSTAPDPKTGTTGSGTSPGTSPENAPAHPTEPGEETSATPS